ncbi:Major facilitator superfamily transporter [Venturia nashicola]|uniref:Major facilitator superfamily transporter n=1 Tax=Venturia nashicola TaxID=86259 RepID=A0A4Z1NP61_9PEZI|nr:Major facilitator superfamily transporter [Venturia nashicola]TLD23532.1 Major facilitator superfamily transporter [Venturia nashicola]
MSSTSSSPPSYAPLHGKEDRDSIDGLDMLPLHRTYSPRRSNAIKAAKIFSALILVAFIVLTFALSFHTVDLLGKIGHLIKEPKPASHQRSYKYPCGQTAAEAKEKGCIFDIMSMAWQSPECFDEDLNAEFMDLGPWKFYSDETATHELSYEQVSQKGQISWAERRYFVTHCIYGWKAMHRAWQRAWRMDSNLASMAHTELCSRVLGNTSVPLNAMTTKIHVDFPSCN